jgi:hypothetical protein
MTLHRSARPLACCHTSSSKVRACRAYGSHARCSSQCYRKCVGHRAASSPLRRVGCECERGTTGGQDGAPSQQDSASEQTNITLMPKLSDLFQSSADICDDDILQLPDIREQLQPRPSPFCVDNNRGGGCVSLVSSIHARSASSLYLLNHIKGPFFPSLNLINAFVARWLTF